MLINNSGSYQEKGNFIVEWARVSALSSAFTDKMEALANLGTACFKDVELDFLLAYPKAMEEDTTLKPFKSLGGLDLENAMHTKIHQIFLSRPSATMADVIYYIVTVKDAFSKETLGCITFMTGGPIPDKTYKIPLLAVSPHVRRQGLSIILLNSLKNIGEDPERMLASTRPSNKAAIGAFKKCGFLEDEKTSTSPHFIKGHWIHLIRECVSHS